MKRDLDLVRLLLIELEGDDSADLTTYSIEQINYHKALIKDAGLAEGVIHYSTSGDSEDVPDLAMLKRLTWEGHEFLDKARNEKIWIKAKEMIKEKGISLSMEAVKIALSEALKAILI